jgi:Ca-activated chloride channel family protein
MRRLVPYAFVLVIGGLLALALTGDFSTLHRHGAIVLDDRGALLLLAACVLLAWVGFHLHGRRVATFSFSRTVDLARSGQGLFSWLAPLPRALRVCAVGFVAVALARPQTMKKTDIEVEGIDIMLVLDMSKSMEERDLRPDRIDAAQRTIRKFLEGRKSDRIGLVVFARQAMTQCPLTVDYGALDRIVADLQIGDIDPMGTAIGDGLGLALANLRRADANTPPDAKKSSKVVILLTDGDSNVINEMAPDESKELAKKMHVKVFTVLMGREQGGEPMVDPFGRQPYAVNPALLKRIAADTGGRYFNAGDDAALEAGFEEVRATLEKAKHRQTGKVFTELYPRFALAALALLLVELALTLTRLRRFP